MRRVRLGPSPIPIPPRVLRGIDAVRESGLTNMLNRPLVAELAAALGFPETSGWILAHSSEYANGIFRGFTAETGTKGKKGAAK